MAYLPPPTQDRNHQSATAVPSGPRCLECGEPTRRGLSESVYPDEPHLWGRTIWLCSCGAFAQCRGDKATARPAGPETKRSRARLMLLAERWRHDGQRRNGWSRWRARKEQRRFNHSHAITIDQRWRGKRSLERALAVYEAWAAQP